MHAPKAILFDMDGTLTAPVFDFPAIRRAMGLPDGVAILEHMALLPPDKRRDAEAVLHAVEDEIAANCPLADGCMELLDAIASRGMKMAVITRNRRDSVNTFIRRHPLPIDVWITREDGLHKPDPYPLLLACQRIAIDPADCWMVGDGQFDVEAGINAGMPTIWLRHGRKRPFAAQPWREIDRLYEVAQLLP